MTGLVDNSSVTNNQPDLTSLGVSLGSLVTGQTFMQQAIDRVDGKIDKVDGKVDGVAATIGAHSVKLENHEGRITTLEAAAPSRRPVHWTTYVGGIGAVVAILVSVFTLLH